MRQRSTVGRRSLLTAAVVFSCGAVVAQAPATNRDAHLLVAAQGKVMVKRNGWTISAPAGFGVVLRRGDLVHVSSPGRATVACADLSLHELPAGRFTGVPCASAEKAFLVYQGSLLNPTRSDASDEIPVVISPRRTKLLSLRPTLRWAPVPGNTRYSIAVRGPGVNWTTEEVHGATSLVYPEGAPALASGATYKVTVTAKGRSSDELPEPGLGFTLLSTDAAKEVRAGAERIRALGLASEAAQLLTAHLYASVGLHAEAIEQLEALAKSQPAPPVWQTLGTLYQAVGLNRLAEERYLLAAKQSLAAGDVETQALAHRALGILYLEAFGLKSEATRSFTDALASFEKLGDAAAVKDVKGRLAP